MKNKNKYDLRRTIFSIKKDLEDKYYIKIEYSPFLGADWETIHNTRPTLRVEYALNLALAWLEEEN